MILYIELQSITMALLAWHLNQYVCRLLFIERMSWHIGMCRSTVIDCWTIANQFKDDFHCSHSAKWDQRTENRIG